MTAQGPWESGHLLWWPPRRLRNRQRADPADRRHSRRRPGRSSSPRCGRQMPRAAVRGALFDLPAAVRLV